MISDIPSSQEPEDEGKGVEIVFGNATDGSESGSSSSSDDEATAVVRKKIRVDYQKQDDTA